MKRTSVAFLITDIADLSGAGGAERFFYDFYLRNNIDEERQYDIHFYTNTVAPLKRVAYLEDQGRYLHDFKMYRSRFLKRLTDKIPGIASLSNMLREFITFVPLYRSFKKNDIKVLHVPLYEAKDYYLIRFFDRLALYRPKISISIVDCRIPYRYFSREHMHYYSSYINYSRLFNKVRIDGILSWYKLFKEFADANKLLRSNPLVYCIRSRYSIVHESGDWLKKKNWIVFAGRLDDQKDPLFFLRAVHKVIEQGKNEGYAFKIFGKGPLRQELEDYITAHKLASSVELSFHPRMQEVFEQSKCFVSTQLYENFPSMSMAEAMACHNAIIAKKVGQTNYFVRDGINGYMVDENDVNDMAFRIAAYIQLSDEAKKKLGENSAALLREEHNFKNFQSQFNEYIGEVLRK